MANESEVIRHQMEETRTSLQDKLETLEQQVKETVQNATEAVTETVSTVKEAVQETVGTVKESVQETVDTVKDTFDLRHQVERHPWAMVCGATAVGFMGGRLLQRTWAASSPPPMYSEPLDSFRAARVSSAYEDAVEPPPSEAAAPAQHWWDALASEYRSELDKVKGLAISTLGGLVGEMLVQSAPAALKEQLKEVVDGVTIKLGGRPLEEPLFGSASAGGNGTHATEERETVAGTRRQWEESASRFDR